MQKQETTVKSLFIKPLLVASTIGLLALTACGDESATEEKVENATEEMSQGVENAAEELQDRSAGEEVGDAVEDTGQAIEDAAEQ